MEWDWVVSMQSMLALSTSGRVKSWVSTQVRVINKVMVKIQVTLQVKVEVESVKGQREAEAAAACCCSVGRTPGAHVTRLAAMPCCHWGLTAMPPAAHTLHTHSAVCCGGARAPAPLLPA